MATAAMDVTAQGAEALATADFQALEQRVLRAVELLRAERDAHSRANARIAELERHAAELEHQLTDQRQQRTDLEHRLGDIEQQLGGKSEHAQRLEGELEQLQQERDQVRGRVERLLRHLDEFTA